jgi:hypothetical protein
MPDDNAAERPEQTGAGGPVRTDEPSWRVNSGLAVLKGAVAVAFLVAALLFRSDPAGFVIGLAAAAALGAFALRDLLVPVRLAADPTGVTVVSGFAGRRHLPWERIERIRVDERRRLGVRSQLLEIDTGDSLHLFSSYELSASCAEVAARLRALRSQATHVA